MVAQDRQADLDTLVLQRLDVLVAVVQQVLDVRIDLHADTPRLLDVADVRRKEVYDVEKRFSALADRPFPGIEGIVAVAFDVADRHDACTLVRRRPLAERLDEKQVVFRIGRNPNAFGPGLDGQRKDVSRAFGEDLSRLQRHGHGVRLPIARGNQHGALLLDGNEASREDFISGLIGFVISLQQAFVHFQDSIDSLRRGFRKRDAKFGSHGFRTQFDTLGSHPGAVFDAAVNAVDGRQAVAVGLPHLDVVVAGHKYPGQRKRRGGQPRTHIFHWNHVRFHFNPLKTYLGSGSVTGVHLTGLFATPSLPLPVWSVMVRPLPSLNFQ